ncbi:MAG TPA: glutamate formimidoyltransferase [Gemmatimonadales bacterium]|nr:glutamate formimidoyltransferase [Gemmatimonadales bacterium]
MLAPLVECVPNFSEGRDTATLEALRTAITRVPGVRLLDVQADGAHNRSVYTFVAPPDAAVEAALAAMRVATRRIDLTKHRGEHPRMGATDVVPFVPVRDVTMDDCVALARRLGESAAAELGLPIYLYARAATRPERERLPDIRKGEFEGLRERIGKDRAADPDFGPARIHPTAGATAVGARPFLVAFNIYLDSADVSIAKEIAKGIRTSSGGLPAVQASGFEVAGKAQVSMNLLDIDTTPPATVFAAVERAARAHEVGISKSEVVGLIPERALLGAGAAYLKLPDPAPHLLEAKIRAAEGEGGNPTVDAWFAELSSAEPAPGGGSAAAFAGAMGAALIAMVARLTIGRKAYAGVEAEAKRVLEAATEAMWALRGLVQADAAAYGLVRLAYQTPKTDAGRRQRIDQALLGAAQTPLETARTAVAVIKLAQAIRAIGNKNARSDATVGEHLARTALAGALENVRVNVAGLSDPVLGKALLEEAERLARELREPTS